MRSTTASTIQSAFPTRSKLSFILPTLILSILFLSISKGGRDSNIFFFAFSEISVFRSNKVTGMFALHNCAAIPLPMVPDPMTTTFFIFIGADTI